MNQLIQQGFSDNQIYQFKFGLLTKYLNRTMLKTPIKNSHKCNKSVSRSYSRCSKNHEQSNAHNKSVFVEGSLGDSFNTFIISAIKTKNPELSVGPQSKRHKMKRPLNEKRSMRRNRLKVTTPVQFSGIADEDVREHQQTFYVLPPGPRVSERESFIEQIVQNTEKRKLLEGLHHNSLELFVLSEKSLNKRAHMLQSYKRKVEESWKRLFKLLKGCDNRDSVIVQQAVKSLVSQRLFLENELAKIETLTEQLKI